MRICIRDWEETTLLPETLVSWIASPACFLQHNSRHVWGPNFVNAARAQRRYVLSSMQSLPFFHFVARSYHSRWSLCPTTTADHVKRELPVHFTTVKAPVPVSGHCASLCLQMCNIPRFCQPSRVTLHPNCQPLD